MHFNYFRINICFCFFLNVQTNFSFIFEIDNVDNTTYMGQKFALGSRYVQDKAGTFAFRISLEISIIPV